MKCTLAWTDQHPAVDHDEHECVFVASTVGHSRHECRCGINVHEEPPLRVAPTS